MVPTCQAGGAGYVGRLGPFPREQRYWAKKAWKSPASTAATFCRVCDKRLQSPIFTGLLWLRNSARKTEMGNRRRRAGTLADSDHFFGKGAVGRSRARPPRSADFQVCCIAGFQTRSRPATRNASACSACPKPATAADLEIGDTAGWETCATGQAGGRPRSREQRR